MDSRIGTQLGKYVITGILGRGGMGVVYEAEDSVLKRKVAVKLLPDSVANDSLAVQRFLREAQAAARLSHPNAVAVHDADSRGGVCFLVMELVRGASAWDRLRTQGPFAWRDATRVIADTCRGLAAAHAAGLIHRDIKPANIMLAADGSVKVADFGLAKVTDQGDTSVGIGGVVGTPQFMSPEQCQAAPLDPRSDIYSVGATYYALLTGRPPFVAESPTQVMFAHCVSPVPDVRQFASEVPERCTAIIRRAMAKEPAERYPDAGAMLADLEIVLGASAAAGSGELALLAASTASVSKRPSGTMALAPVGKNAKRDPLIWVYAGAAAVAAIVAAIAMRSGRQDTHPPADATVVKTDVKAPAGSGSALPPPDSSVVGKVPASGKTEPPAGKAETVIPEVGPIGPPPTKLAEPGDSASGRVLSRPPTLAADAPPVRDYACFGSVDGKFEDGRVRDSLPDHLVDFSLKVEAPDGRTLAWSTAISAPDGKLDLADRFGRNAKCLAYLGTQIEVPRDIEAILWPAHEGGCRMRVNGATVYEVPGARAAAPAVPVRLKAGRNSVFLRVRNSGLETPWFCSLRISDAGGRAIPGLKAEAPSLERWTKIDLPAAKNDPPVTKAEPPVAKVEPPEVQFMDTDALVTVFDPAAAVAKNPVKVPAPAGGVLTRPPPMSPQALTVKSYASYGSLPGNFEDGKPKETLPDHRVDWSLTGKGADNRNVKWSHAVPEGASGRLDCAGYFGTSSSSLVYLANSLESNQDTDAILWLTHNGGCRLRLNGQTKYEIAEARPDPQAIPVHLRAGRNTVFLRVTHSGQQTPWFCSLHVTDMQGRPILGLKSESPPEVK